MKAVFEILERARDLWPAEDRGRTSKEIMDEMYDEHGLPK